MEHTDLCDVLTATKRVLFLKEEAVTALVWLSRRLSFQATHSSCWLTSVEWGGTNVSQLYFLSAFSKVNGKNI